MLICNTSILKWEKQNQIGYFFSKVEQVFIFIFLFHKIPEVAVERLSEFMVIFISSCAD